MQLPNARRGPRIRVLLGAQDLDIDLSSVDAVVRPVRPRQLAVGLTAVRLGRPPVIEVGCAAFSARENRDYLLARAYRAVLEAADSIGARRIALPTELAVHPWPFDEAIRVALGTLESTPTQVREVLVMTHTPAALEAWTERLARR